MPTLSPEELRAAGNTALDSASSLLMPQNHIAVPAGWAAQNMQMTNDFISPNDSDKVVRKLDDFPELVQALRNGDHVLARKLFAQLFEECDGPSRQQTLNPNAN